MRHWLLKTEPGCYSLDDLRKDGETLWTGIRNYQARNMLRDELAPGDLCLFYHSGGEPSAVGVCRVTKKGEPDPTQFDSKDDHYDPDSDPREPRWYAVRVAYEAAFERPVGIGDMRKNPRLSSMKLLQKGSRLSVLPVSPAEFAEVMRMAV